MDIEKIVHESHAAQNKEELLKLLTLLKGEHFVNILEIGIHQGHSIETWNKVFNPKRLVGVEWDIDAIDFDLMDRIGAVIVKGDSKDENNIKAVKELFPGGVDFLFIDGDHAYESVKKDYETYSPLVTKGGVVAFHDAALVGCPTSQVNVFWKELTKRKGRYNFISNGGKDGGTGYGVIWK